MIRAWGERFRRAATIFSSAGTVPAAPSWSAVRSLRPPRHGAAEDVERQITIAVVIAAEMAALLRAVQEMAHRVEVQHHFARVLGQSAHPHRQQTLFNRCRIVGELVSASGFVVGKLQPVEGARRRQGRAAEGGIESIQPQRIELVAGRGQERIPAQESVVIEIIVTQRLAVKPLGQQLRQGVIDLAGGARVVEAAGQRAGQAQPVIDLAEQEHAAIAGEIPGREIHHDPAGAEVGKEQRLVATVCRGRGGAARSVRAFVHSLSDPFPASSFDPL